MTSYTHALTLWTGSLTLTLALAGCPDRGDTSGTETSTGAGSSSGAPTSGDASTGGDATGTSAGTSDGATTDASGTTEVEGSGGLGETGGMLPAPLCEQVCEHLVACRSPLAPTLEGCVQACQDSPFKNSPACVNAAEGWWSCLGELACADVQQPGPAACELEYAEYLLSCGDCIAQLQPDVPVGVCVAIAECPDAVAVAFVCMDDTCTCQLDDEVIASCPAEGVCAGDPAAVLSAAEECCGVSFPG